MKTRSESKSTAQPPTPIATGDGNLVGAAPDVDLLTPTSSAPQTPTTPVKKVSKRKAAAGAKGGKRQKKAGLNVDAEPGVASQFNFDDEAAQALSPTTPTPDGSNAMPLSNLVQAKPNVPANAAAKPAHAVSKPPPAKVVSPAVASEATEGEEQKPQEKLRPVDDAIEICGRNPDDFELVGNEFDVTLNQCNIGDNNNKYYRMQLLKDPKDGSFYTWTRWGRVGEEARKNAAKLMGPYAQVERAQSAFEKKWKDKTGNLWENRDKIVAKKKKYVPVLINTEADPDGSNDAAPLKLVSNVKVEYEVCKLDAKTEELITVIHNRDVMEAQMLDYDLDLRKMPLGALDKAQVERGADVLNEIKAALSSYADRDTLSELSSKFYTTIPHSFGRKRPPVIGDTDQLQRKFDMLDCLLDIESTASKVEELNKKNATAKTEVLPNLADQQYANLGSKLRLVGKKDPQYKLLLKYFEKTRGEYFEGAELLDIWRIERNGEGERFEEFASLENHRLLWHGTSVAVVAAILGGGLRIMPNSGGRVGKGIYLANEMNKSAHYTSGHGSKFACMFLAEAALGRMDEITADNPSLRAAPKSFHSVLAKGTQSPQHYVDTELDGRAVAVPQGEPVPNGISSSFSQDEYLVYKEAQVRLRFICTVKFEDHY